jgi:guanine deaminase
MEVIAANGKQLLDWLEDYVFPVDGAFSDPEKARQVAEVFLDELLRNGTTAAMTLATVHPASVNAFFAAAEKRRLRMICGKVLMDRNAPEYLTDTPETGFEQCGALIERWHGGGRLGYAVTPRFAPTSSDRQLSRCRSLSERLFALAILGTDRMVKATCIMGEAAYRADARRHGKPFIPAGQAIGGESPWASKWP